MDNPTQLLENLGVPTEWILVGAAGGFFIKYILDLAFKKETIIFSKLHDRRAEVIEELYSKLVDLVPKAEKYSMTWDRKKDKNVFIDAALIFVDFSQKKRIFFEEITCKILDEIDSKYMDFLKHMKELSRENKGEFSEENNKKRDYLMDEVKKIIRSRIPLLKKELEREFRKMLGIQDESLFKKFLNKFKIMIKAQK